MFTRQLIKFHNIVEYLARLDAQIVPEFVAAFEQKTELTRTFKADGGKKLNKKPEIKI